MGPSQERIALNIGGVRYETYAHTLRAFPGTKLCRLTEPHASGTFDYDPNAKAFFFDRDAALFEEVLGYCQTRRLHCPAVTCRSVLEEELAFWGIRDVALAPCCDRRLAAGEEEQNRDLWAEEEEEERQDGSGHDLRVQGGGGWAGWRSPWKPKIWSLFENPRSSLGAKCLAGVSLLFNLGICILVLVKAHLSWHRFFSLHALGPGNATSAGGAPGRPSHERVLSLVYLELGFVLWFTLEFFARLASCPAKKKFLKSPLNLADFLSLFPVFVELFSHGHASGNEHLEHFLDHFQVVYLFKLLKTIKLVEAPLMFKVLCYTSRCLLRELLLLAIIFALEVLFFGTFCYCSETIFAGHVYSHIPSMPAALWWAAITLTTVGYGDMFPMAHAARFVAACAAVCGVLNLIVPIPIFLVKFKGYYDTAVAREKAKRLNRRAPALPS